LILVGEPAFGALSRAMRLLDTDNDGTVDLGEAKKAASTLFDKLDRDHDGTSPGRARANHRRTGRRQLWQPAEQSA
jgi:EF hand domain-containing protein